MINQNGCNVTFLSLNEPVFTGTISGTSIQITGKLSNLYDEEGIAYTQDNLTGSGTISEDRSNINVTASGYASGTYYGDPFTVNAGMLNATFSRLPRILVASGSLLYVGFGFGTEMWDGSTWTKLSPADPQNMVASGSLLYVDYGASGTWMYNGSIWTKLSPADPQSMAASGSLLYVDSYSSIYVGDIWMWNGSEWTDLYWELF